MYYHTKDQFRIHYVISNKIMLPKIRFITKAKNLHKPSEGSYTEERISLNQERTEVTFQFSDIGTYNIYLESVKVYDCFHIVSFTRKFPFSKRVSIYPSPLKYNKTKLSSKTALDGDVEMIEKGNDYTEIFGFHEYRENEPFKHVHPILSAKFDEYIIKEGSNSQKKTYIYSLKQAEKFKYLENDLKKLYMLFQDVVLTDNDYFIIQKVNTEYPIYNHYDIYRFMDDLYQEYLS